MLRVDCVFFQRFLLRSTDCHRNAKKLGLGIRFRVARRSLIAGLDSTLRCRTR
jgi:hypothetical protein